MKYTLLIKFSMHLLKENIFKFLSFDFFLLSSCTTKQWLANHSLRDPELERMTLLITNRPGTGLTPGAKNTFSNPAAYFVTVGVEMCGRPKNIKYTVTLRSTKRLGVGLKSSFFSFSLSDSLHNVIKSLYLIYSVYPHFILSTATNNFL
jgi:hypothetical protein